MTGRPPRPKPIDEASIEGMTRRELRDVLLTAVEYYQALPRWPRLTAKQDAEYQTFWRLYRKFFHPDDALQAAADYIHTGRRDYWEQPAVPRDEAAKEA